MPDGHSITWGDLPIWSSFKKCHQNCQPWQFYPHFFPWIQTPTRWHFCENVEKLPDLGIFFGTFQHLERVGQKTAGIGSFYGTFQQKKKNTRLVAKGALAHRLQHRTPCKIQNGRQWAQKLPTGSGKLSTHRFWGILSNLR